MTGVPKNSDANADEASMAGHPSFPYPKQNQGVFREFVPPVEQSVAYPSPEQYADNHKGHEIHDLFAVVRASVAPVVSFEKKKGAYESGKVCNSVPTDSTWSPMGKGVGELPKEGVQVVNPIIGCRYFQSDDCGFGFMRALCLRLANSLMSTAMSSCSKISWPMMLSIMSSMAKTPATDPNSSTTIES